MPQEQCPWCGKCGERYPEGTPKDERGGPHADGSECVCRHVDAHDRRSALYYRGRYFCRRRGRWVCPWCGTDDRPTQDEIDAARAYFEYEDIPASAGE